MGLLNLQHQMLLSAPHLNTEIAEVATFDADMNLPVKTFMAGFKQLQDLHGYSLPWANGISGNLIPDGTDTSNGYVSGKFLKDDGDLETSNIGYYVSEYFSVSENLTYTYSTNRTSAVNPSVAFYDSSKQFLSATAVGSTQSVTVTAPTGAVYARASQLSTWTTAGDELFQFETGSVATTPKPYSNICPIIGRKNISICHTNENILGGQYLLERLSYAVPSGTTNKTNKTFAFGASAAVPHWIFSYYNYPFKENTQYTFIITYSKNSGTSTNIRVGYTDGTTTNITSSGTAKKTIAFVTAEGKTVKYFGKYTGSGTTTLYYEESGLFEGALTASDYKPYVGGFETVSFAQGKNLFDGEVTSGYFINETGQIAVTASSCYSGIIPVVSGNTYTYSGICGASSNNKRIHAYASGIWQEQITVQNINANSSFSITFTVPSGANGIRISARTDDRNTQLELGPSATSYAAFTGEIFRGYITKDSNGNTVLVKSWAEEVVGQIGGSTGWSLYDFGTVPSFGGYYATISKTLSGSIRSYGTTVNGDGNGAFNMGEWRYGPNNPYWRANTKQDGSTNTLRIVFLSKTPIDTVEKVNAFLAKLPEPFQVVYKLYSAQGLQVNDISVPCLLGTNNIWNGACWDENTDGDIKLKYWNHQ